MDAPTLIEVPETSTDEWPLWAVRAHAEKLSDEAIVLLMTSIDVAPYIPTVKSFLEKTLEELLCEGFSTQIKRFEAAADRVSEITDGWARHEFPEEYSSLLKCCSDRLTAAAEALLDLKRHEVVTYFHLVPHGSAGLLGRASLWN